MVTRYEFVVILTCLLVGIHARWVDYRRVSRDHGMLSERVPHLSLRDELGGIINKRDEIDDHSLVLKAMANQLDSKSEENDDGSYEEEDDEGSYEEEDDEGSYERDENGSYERGDEDVSYYSEEYSDEYEDNRSSETMPNNMPDDE